MSRSGRRNEAILEEFDLWLKTAFIEEFRFMGHTFKRVGRNEVLIDGGLFTEKEVRQILQMLTSRNPIDRLNATMIIWERNGTLIKVLIFLALVALIVIYIYVRR
ncbi:hypothetical protein DRO55_01650 [Candidatus Bathyarchaeota archaeon]|nr:MAG: hypothetical protein DRO55_01650 [Candidatus Bathyarchaeota archaeon]